LSYSYLKEIENTDQQRIREECLKSYIRRNQGCNKKAAVMHCMDKVDANYNTLWKDLLRLEEDGAVTHLKKGKSHLCYLVTENLLVSIPSDLEQINANFIDFVNEVKEVEGKKLYSDCEYVYSGLKAMQDVEIEKRIQILPYEVLEVTKELYMTFFESILPDKIENKEHINRLYGNYSIKKESMESFLCQNFPISSDLTSLLEYRKHEAPLGKLCNIVDICKHIGIEVQLNTFLDFIWSRNIETCILLYQLSKYQRKEEDNQKKEVIEYNVNDIIDEIRSGVNYLINGKEM
jgi:hypothetical protein